MHLKNLNWHDGMLLGPQHLIYNDERIQSVMQQKFTAIFPYSWGIEQLSLNEHALQNGIVEILSLKAHFPDGTVISIAGNASVKTLVLDISLNIQRLAIFLCLRPYVGISEKLANYQDKTELPERRVAQLIDGELVNEGELETSEYQLTLVTGQKAPEHYLSIKLCEVAINDARVDIRPYIPPLIRHDVSSKYQELLKKLYSALLHFTESVRESSVVKGNTRSAQTNIGAETLALNVATLLKLSLWINGEVAHPFHIHKELSESYVQFHMLLNKETLNAKQMLIFKYDHGRIYSNLNLLIGKYIETIDSYYKKIKIIKSLNFDGTYFHTELPCDLANIEKIGFMVSGGQDGFVKQAKIASRQLMPMLIANSISGLAVEPLRSVPMSGELAANAEFFELQKEGEIWDSIVRYENLAIYANHKLPNCQISLLDISGL